METFAQKMLILRALSVTAQAVSSLAHPLTPQYSASFASSSHACTKLYNNRSQGSTEMKHYSDRYEAGSVLADALQEYAHKKEVIVLALPRGGVPVGFEIARRLSLPLDILVVRKLGVPGHEELAMGAIASGDTVFLNQPLLAQLKIPLPSVEAVLQAETREQLRRERLYRANRPFPSLQNNTVILVDDGIATGASMQAAIAALRTHNPACIIIAVPVAAAETCDVMSKLADRVICPLRPIHFQAVGCWYDNFPQVSDDEVIELLRQSAHRTH